MIETLPIGRRLAFDAAQGRLWVVCRHCAKWNLVPFESRLESIDACERLFRDTPTRYSTDNIGLARVKEGLELVRIGTAQRPEFAGWRYGEQYRRRRRNGYLMGAAGVGVAFGALALLNATGITAAGAAWGLLKGGWEAGLNRKARFKIADPVSGDPLQFARHDLRTATISWEEGTPSLDVRIPKRNAIDDPILGFRGAEMQSVGRKVGAGLNVLSGTSEELQDATRLLAQQKGDLSHWLRVRTDSHCGPYGENQRWDDPPSGSPKHWQFYTTPYLVLDKLPARDRLAIELWMNEDIERQWLEGELTLLEREWRQAEELAKISDGLALPETADEELEQRRG
jgi:hypothetical protein